MTINFDDDTLATNNIFGVESLRCLFYINRFSKYDYYSFGGINDEENNKENLFLKTLNLQ